MSLYQLVQQVFYSIFSMCKTLNFTMTEKRYCENF